MPKKPKPSAVVFAKDVGVLSEFYKRLGDMCATHQDQQHTVLDDVSFQLVVHAIPEQIARKIVISTPPAVRSETSIKLCIPVASISDARSIAAALGGSIADPAAEWESRQFRACDGYDPEGNVLQVREGIG